MRQTLATLVSTGLILAAIAVPAKSDTLNSAELADYAQRIEQLETQIQALHQEPEACTSDLCQCPCYEPGWYGSVDYLNWQVRRSDQAFAILDPAGLGVPNAGQPVLSLELGPASGFRLGGGRRTVDGWEVGIQYTHFSTDDRQTFAPGAGQVLAVLASPAGGLTNADSVTASSEFDYDVIDLQAGRWFDTGTSMSVLAMGGFRFASIDHRLQATYDGGVFVNGLVDVPTNLDAFGGRLGGAVNWNLTQTFSVFANGAFSLNATNVSASRLETNANAVVIDAQRSSHPIVPVAELSLGMQYQIRSLTLGASYEWTNWFNAVTPLQFADNFNGGTLGPTQSDLGLQGLVVHAAVTY